MGLSSPWGETLQNAYNTVETIQVLSDTSNWLCRMTSVGYDWRSDMQDCTATLDLLFDQLKNEINEATRHDDGSEKGLKKKGTQLEAMQAV